MSLAYLFDSNIQFQDKSGNNNVNGFLRVYIDNTDDRAVTYKDFNGTLNQADIRLDNNGRAVVIVDDSKTYRLEVYGTTGVLLWTLYPISPKATGINETLEALVAAVKSHTIAIEGLALGKKNKQQAKVISGTPTQTVKSLSQNADGEITVEFEDIDFPYNIQINSPDDSIEVGTPVVDTERKEETIPLSVKRPGLVKADSEDAEPGTLIDKLEVVDNVRDPEDPQDVPLLSLETTVDGQGNRKVAINEDGLHEALSELGGAIDNIVDTIDELDMDSVPHAYLGSTLFQSAGDSVTTGTPIDVFSCAATIVGDCFEFEQTTTIDDTPFGYVWIEPGTYLINASVTLQWVGNPRGTFVAKVGKVMGENVDFSQEQELLRSTTRIVTIPSRMKLSVNITYDAGTPVMGFLIQSLQVVKLAGGMSQTNVAHDSTLTGKGSVSDPLGVDEAKVAQSTLAAIKNLATASDNDLVVGNYFVIDSLDGPKKLGSEVIGNMAKTLDNLYKLSHDNYYNINTHGAFITKFQVQAKKQYSFYLKSESLVSTQGKFNCLYVGSNSIEDCTADELYNGVYFKYTATSSGYVGIRTYETGVVVRLDVFEIENATSIASAINDKCDKIFNTYSKSITFSQTTPQTTGITLKQGFKYRLYAKSDSLITSIALVEVFYLQENPQTPATSLGFINSYKVLDGFEFEYTAPVSGSLLARSNQAGITLNVVVKEEIPFATVDDVNKVDSNVKDIEKDVYSDRDFDISMYINQTVALDTTFHLHKDRYYTLYAKSDILVTAVSSISIFYRKTSGGSEVIASCSPQELLDGFTVDIYNETDGILFVRTRQTGVFLTCTVKAKDPTTSGNNQFIGKSWAAYGDSIAAISNGNGLMTPGWARYVNYKMPFENFFGRSIGGTLFGWGNGGGSVSFVHTDGSYDSRNDSYNKDNYTGTIPSGCTAIRSCLCSWDRITHMFPESIKNDIDIVCIMGGTNDNFSVTDASFIDGNVTDVEWSQSGADYYGKFNGDFNIDTIKGGLASAIMKFQVWMPNAIVVVCTPLSGHSIGGAGYVATNLYEITFDKRTAVEEIAKRASCPCIDVYSICGISPFNRTEYITDKVHPYTDAGKKMLARALIMGLKNIEPMI